MQSDTITISGLIDDQLVRTEVNVESLENANWELKYKHKEHINEEVNLLDVEGNFITIRKNTFKVDKTTGIRTFYDLLEKYHYPTPVLEN